MEQIKKGDKFKCIKTVVMNDSGKVEYLEGVTYISEEDDCITNLSGDKNHIWGLSVEWQRSFERVKEEQQIFKVSDKVYDYRYGWGEVNEIMSDSIVYPISVIYGELETACYSKEGKFVWKDKIASLSFTEYDFINGGFSQERPKPEIKKGQLIYVKDSGEWKMRFFSHFEGNSAYCFEYQEIKGKTAWYSEYSLTNPLEEK